MHRLPCRAYRGHIPRWLNGAVISRPVMTDTPQLLLVHHLKALRLPTFLREYVEVVKQCAAEGIDHSHYFLRLARCTARHVYMPEGGAGTDRPGTPHGRTADQSRKALGCQKSRQLRLQGHALTEQDAGDGTGPL